MNIIQTVKYGKYAWNICLTSYVKIMTVTKRIFTKLLRFWQFYNNSYNDFLWNRAKVGMDVLSE
jgi:hypothetical protein